MAYEIPPRVPPPLLNYQSPGAPPRRSWSALKVIGVILLTLVLGSVLVVAIAFGACMLMLKK
jgi:hypothetical protein